MAFWIENRRQLGFVGEMKSESLDDFCQKLQSFPEVGKPLEIFLNSGGGSTAVITTILHLLRSYREAAVLRTIGTGWVASSAVLLLAAGTPGERYILGKDTFVLVHEISFEPSKDWNSTSDLEQRATRGRMIQNRAMQQLASMTQRKVGFWKRKIEGKGDITLTAQEAVALGIADHIVETMPAPLVSKVPTQLATLMPWYRAP